MIQTNTSELKVKNITFPVELPDSADGLNLQH